MYKLKISQKEELDPSSVQNRLSTTVLVENSNTFVNTKKKATDHPQVPEPKIPKVILMNLLHILQRLTP